MTTPTLYGDGVNDDAPALQWMANESARENSPLVLHGGRYCIKSNVTIRDIEVDICGNVFLCHDGTTMVFDSIRGKVKDNVFKDVDGVGVKLDCGGVADASNADETVMITPNTIGPIGWGGTPPDSDVKTGSVAEKP